MKKKLSFLILALFILACAGQQAQTMKDATYKSLLIAGTAYDTSMKTISALQKQGYVSTETRTEINKYGTYFHDGYHAAVDSLAVYAEKGDLDSYQTTQDMLLGVGGAIGQFLAIVNPIIIKYGYPEVVLER